MPYNLTLNAIRLAMALILAGVLLSISGCNTVPPYQRAYLAKAEMGWEPLPLASAMDSHVYFSKEGSNGGLSAAGGGCGCN